jgi:hypothetical protein
MDTLVAQPHRGIVGELAAQVAGDLRWAPSLGKQLCDDLAEIRVGLDAATMSTCSTHHGPAVGFKQSVSAVAAAVASQLPGYRRRRPADLGGDPADAQPGTAEVGDLDAFILRQVPRTDLAHRQAIQRHPTALQYR